MSFQWLALVVVMAVGVGGKTPAETRQGTQPAETPPTRQSAQVGAAPTTQAESQVKQACAVVGETVTLPSGLKYQDQWIGPGREVKKGSIIVVHYTGFLAANQDVFDSSVGREPLQVKVGAGQVIKGWDEGLVGMRVGGKRILTIPAKLGYGNERKGPIPPNSDLIFHIEVLRMVN